MDRAPGFAVHAVGRLSRRRGVRLSALLLGISLLLPLAWGCERVTSQERALDGIWLDQTGVSGLDRAALVEVLSGLAPQLAQQRFSLRVGQRVVRSTPAQAGVRVDVDSTVAQVLAEGRQGSLWAQFSWWLERLWSAKVLPVVVRLDSKTLLSLATEWEETALDERPSEGGVRAVNGKLTAIAPRAGVRIDVDALAKLLADEAGQSRQRSWVAPLKQVRPTATPADVERALSKAQAMVKTGVTLLGPESSLRFSSQELAAALISLPSSDQGFLLSVNPKALEKKLAPLREELETPPRDASFVVDKEGKVRIVASRMGTRIEPELLAQAVLQATAAPKRVALLPLSHQAEPSLTTEDARALGITHQVAEFSTRHPCCQARVQNIHRIADLLDGTVVKAGETFSINEHVGPRTLKNGFVAAPSIVEGEMEDTIGGGVSQFATTFYNALFYGGYDIIERQPHSYWFPRYPEGHEATLSYPKPDVIFKNDTAYGVLIKTEYTGTRITVRLYGNNENRRVKAYVSHRMDVVDPPVELVADESVPPDEERVTDAGGVGWSVIVGRRMTFADGQKKEEKRKVTYRPRTRRVAVHPCRIPEGEPGYTGQDCPEPEDAEIDEPEDEHGPDAPTEP